MGQALEGIEYTDLTAKRPECWDELSPEMKQHKIERQLAAWGALSSVGNAVYGPTGGGYK